MLMFSIGAAGSAIQTSSAQRRSAERSLKEERLLQTICDFSYIFVGSIDSHIFLHLNTFLMDYFSFYSVHRFHRRITKYGQKPPLVYHQQTCEAPLTAVPSRISATVKSLAGIEASPLRQNKSPASNHCPHGHLPTRNPKKAWKSI